MKKLYIIIAFFIAYNGYAQNSEDLLDFSLEDLMNIQLSIGSKTVKNPDQTPGAITVISRDQIEQMQARTLRDVLNVVVPGMDVVPTYFAYGNNVNSGIYARGVLSDFNQQILMLFNGQNKFNESTFGSPYPGMLFTLENVERIEVNSSPAPLLGGSALTTINIITREKEMNGTEVYLNSGFNSEDGYQSKRFTVNHAAKLRDWSVGTSLQYYDDLGQAHPDQELFGFGGATNSFRDGVKSSINVLVNVKSPNELIEFGSWYKDVRRDAFFSNLSASGSSDLYEFSSNSFHNYLKVQAHQDIEVSAGVSLFDNSNSVNLDQPIPIGVNQRINVPFQTEISNYNTYLKVDYLKDYNLKGEHTINAGVKIEREGQSDHAISQLNDVNQFVDVTDQQEEEFARELPDDHRTIVSLYAENNWNMLSNLSLLAGFRYDYYANFKDTEIAAFNPRIAVAFVPNDHIILKAQYSSAVRPPSLYEIEGNNFLPQLYGNENLDFESLDTYEFSVKYRNKGFEVTLNPYVAELDDHITYELSSLDTTSLVATNSSVFDVLGVEITTRYQWKEGNYFFLNASQQKSENLDNERTDFIPSTYINGGLNLGWENVNVNVTGSYRGDRELPEDFLEEKADEMFLVNSAITVELAEGIDTYIQIQNLFNERYSIPLSLEGAGVPIRRRTFNLGLNLKF